MSSEEFPDPYRGERTEEEFQLGMALFLIVDSDENPEEYDTDGTFEFIDLEVEKSLAYWKLKYEQQINDTIAPKTLDVDGE